MCTPRRCLLLLVLVWMAAASAASAQQLVEGLVYDSADETPLPGVNIRLQGTTLGTITGVDGRYEFRVPEAEGTLVFSFVGYETQEVAIAGRARIDVALTPAVLTGEEVVVVGYTTQRRRNITGAVSSIEPDALEIRTSATVEDALKGRLPGVEVNSTGEPGEGAQIIIRGQRFVSGSGEPLYVVDGMYMAQNPNLNPDDIASIQVLKDASAAAQYGSQSANGVVVITTKRGRQGENRVAFSSYLGYQEVPKTIDVMSAADWAVINQMAYANAGLPPMPGSLDPAADTDWQDALMTRGAIQNYNLQVSGGAGNATYLISGGYVNQDGAVIETGFERYSLRVNTELKKGILTLGETAAVARSTKANMVGFPFIDAVRMLPTIPVYDPNNLGGYGYGSPENNTFGTNPIGAQELQDNSTRSNELFGTAYAEVDLPANFRYRFNLGLQYQDWAYEVFNRIGVIRQNETPLPARLRETADQRTSVLYENLLHYDAAHGPHRVSAVAGLTEQRVQFSNLMAYREAFSDEDIRVINAGTENLENGGYDVETARRSYLARANYDFADRYLLTASFRRDGSSRFGPDHRWGSFYSGSVGWVLSNEAFYAQLPVLGTGVDYVKLRASYGELGNEDVGDYQFAARIVPNLSYLYGDQVGTGAIQLSLATPDIRWQENRMTNLGLDLALLDYRVTLNADYYISESGGTLVQAPLPWSLGSESSPFVNAGTIRNSGFELGAAFRRDGEAFDFNAGLNLTTTRNEVVDLGNGGQPIFSGPYNIARTQIGGPVGEFFVRKTDGLFQSEAEVQAHSWTDPETGATRLIQPDAQPGDVRFVDLNDDGLITDLDRYGAGSAVPDLEMGFFFDGSYKQFDLGLSLRGAFGNEIFSIPKFWTDRLDDNANYREGLQPWTPENPNTDVPRAVIGTAGAMNADPVSDRWIEDGSYLRIQNVVLGYTLPKRYLRSLGVADGGLRLYVNVQNLHTFTSYTFWDPENVGMGILARGVDDGQIFPNVRSYTVGLDLTL